jgi:hypothetical protein
MKRQKQKLDIEEKKILTDFRSGKLHSIKTSTDNCESP